MSNFALVFLIICWFSNPLVDSCFITNCPRGGKRSMAAAGPFSPEMRQCLTCGPGGEGRCFGPDLCCGPDMGCFKGTSEASVCRREAMMTSPCVNDVPACKAVRRGQCVLKGYCCNDQGECQSDTECLFQRDDSNQEMEWLDKVARMIKSNQLRQLDEAKRSLER